MIPREQSDPGLYCLQYRVTKKMKLKREQMTSRDWQYNPNKPSVLFVGHRQTALTQFRRCV